MEISKVKLTEYNVPWIEQRADPYVCKREGWYYFTASVPEYDRIILRRASSLRDLQTAKEHVIWTKHKDGIMSEHIWAPELHYIDGKWYIYFAAGEKENVWDIRPYVLECSGQDPIDDPWIELGKMQRAKEDVFSFEAFSLDGTVFENKGEKFFVWAEKVGVGKQISNLYIAKMETPNKLKTVQVLLTTPDYDWERVNFWVNEGPAVVKRNGTIYLTFSASSTGACYCVGLLTADENTDLLDPGSWKKERYPVLTSDSQKGIYGPGHNCFTQSEDGKDLMIYHARQYPEIEGDPLYDPNRHAMIMEIEWNEDGTPIFEYKNQK